MRGNLLGLLIVLAFSILIAPCVQAQSASVSGQVIDTTGAVIPDVQITLTNTATNTSLRTKTNKVGIYNFPFVKPGTYLLRGEFTGFEPYTENNITVSTAQALELDFRVKVSGSSQSVTVDGSGAQINTTDASVSTVIDRQFVENIPLNGRSFQSLMTAIPGVSAVPSQGAGQSGEITVNGQRTEANQFTVDGVSANTGVEGYPTGTGAGFSGSLAGESVIGTTQSLVSIDALEEFRATTSTYSAEYGRTPGGQFIFNTRSGTNVWHGSLFDYFRNDALDANNYFNKRTIPVTSRQAERQNDFGGTLGGPIDIPHLYDGRDKSFFFFSYEGLRLSAPVAAFTTQVPDLSLRQNAPDAVRPFLTAYPVPNGAEIGNGFAYYTGGYSAPSSIDTSSIRLDHHFNDRLSVFGRYSDSPSNATVRANQATGALSAPNPAEIDPQTVHVRTVTGGATYLISPLITNEFRVNESWNNYFDKPEIDAYGGATPLTVASSGAPGLTDKSWIFFYLDWGTYPGYRLYPRSALQSQFNVVDKVTFQIGRHQFKTGIDYRRTATDGSIADYFEQPDFESENQIVANSGSPNIVISNNRSAKPVYSNLSAFLQDEWKVNSRLALSLGLRWDMNPPPQDAGGNQPYTVDQLTDLATTKVAPYGTPLWQTTHANFGPRLGMAYQFHQTPGRETVLRAGFGQFYDTGNTTASLGYEYGVGITNRQVYTNVAFPIAQSLIDAIPAPSTSTPYGGYTVAFDPHLKQPYTLQWNVALEQAMGAQQTFTMSYVASSGRHLLSQFEYEPSSLGNTNFYKYGLFVTQNQGWSSYQALQVQFQRKLSKGLQLVSSYTWSHALDNSTSNFTLTELLRGPSDYDIRNNFQLALTYDLPSHYSSRLASLALNNWSVDLRTTARSALPVDVTSASSDTDLTGTIVSYHPNRVIGEPLYVHDPDAPGGRSINYAAYQPAYEADGVTLTEGDAGRNSARGFDAVQQDVAVRRDFHFTERFGMQLRVESFNLLNHAIFGNINNLLSYGRTGTNRFGIATNTLNGQLGGLNSLYQVGGPRSLQLALKLHF